MNNDLNTFRTLYRYLQGEALSRGFARDAAEFNRFALALVADDVKAAARAGSVDAAMDLCEAAERWLEDEMAEGAEGEFDYAAEAAMAAWGRACDARLAG